ncbi:truncated transcription factor CAULIFLOWER D-like isoform X3 [Phragmites australis]|uniref:truncated transcription factor CAULIFLOWER D-like isoform X3 n=1 Tax=Phragmites australis TaxID=29695 RepID=UPI002D76BEAF|nr:truncated transcription factor CAULIFLOWER D-like isoform X3 [Phragmites australis]
MGRGRGRVEVRRIENSVSRQVTFSKRRRGLAKKAHELAVLCDADVALLIFSEKGRLHDYATNDSMDRILDRYERYLLCEGGYVMEEHSELQVGRGNDMSYDDIKLRSRIEALQKSQRNLMGEQLDALTLREVQLLEHQIDSALRNVRSRKDHVLLNLIGDLRKKETFLMEQNRILEEKKEKAELEAPLHTKNSTASTAAATALPNLNICAGASDKSGPATVPPGAASALPWWILRPSANG